MVIIPLLVIPVLLYYVGAAVLLFALMPLYALFFASTSESHPDPDDPPKDRDDIPKTALHVLDGFFNTTT